MDKTIKEKIIECLKKEFPDWEGGHEETLSDALSYIGEAPIIKFFIDGDWQTQLLVINVLEAIKNQKIGVL